MQGAEELEGLVLAHHLHERRNHYVGGAGGVRVRHLDLPAIGGVQQVGPAPRLRQVASGDQLRVEAEAEHAGVDADGPPLRLPGSSGVSGPPTIERPDTLNSGIGCTKSQ